MPIPQVNDRIKEAPVVVLRAVFAGIGQILLTADKVRARAAEQVWTPDRAAAKMMFHGTHRAKFFGVEATGRAVHWSGAALFTMRGGRIAELWVLGDVDDLKRQLMPDEPARSFSV